MIALVVILWNVAALSVGLAWLALLSDNRSHAPAFFLAAAAVLAVLGCLIDGYFGLGLSS